MLRKKDMMFLQQNFQTEHERLLCIIKGNNAFQKFASNFWDYKAWDSGAETFHLLIDGQPPSTLKEVLGAVLVVSALASVLDVKKETFGCETR